MFGVREPAVLGALTRGRCRVCRSGASWCCAWPGTTSRLPASSGTQKLWITLQCRRVHRGAQRSVARGQREVHVTPGRDVHLVGGDDLLVDPVLLRVVELPPPLLADDGDLAAGAPGFSARSKIVLTVGTAITARIRAGTSVQPISSGVLPWICFGRSSRALAVAEAQRDEDRRDEDEDADGDGHPQDRVKRLSICCGGLAGGPERVLPVLRTGLARARGEDRGQRDECREPPSPACGSGDAAMPHVRGVPPAPESASDTPRHASALYPRPFSAQQLVLGSDGRRSAGIRGP